MCVFARAQDLFPPNLFTQPHVKLCCVHVDVVDLWVGDDVNLSVCANVAILCVHVDVEVL